MIIVSLLVIVSLKEVPLLVELLLVASVLLLGETLELGNILGMDVDVGDAVVVRPTEGVVAFVSDNDEDEGPFVIVGTTLLDDEILPPTVEGDIERVGAKVMVGILIDDIDIVGTDDDVIGVGPDDTVSSMVVGNEVTILSKEGDVDIVGDDDDVPPPPPDNTVGITEELIDGSPLVAVGAVNGS
mmetsp:Transcript_25445/g.54746  ORF Transcript_25445/g.54746 Transcript_25445/m.54746 type:complete len:185 (-) Transcript_25445:1657-2211(-)